MILLYLPLLHVQVRNHNAILGPVLLHDAIALALCYYAF